MQFVAFLVMSSAFHCYSVMKRMAVGYAPNGSVAPPQDLGWLSPAGQMYSTVDDLAKVTGMRLLSVCLSVCLSVILLWYCLLSMIA
jgi:hypothetical protein